MLLVQEFLHTSWGTKWKSATYTPQNSHGNLKNTQLKQKSASKPPLLGSKCKLCRVSSAQKPQDYVKKIAVYRDRLAVQLPDKARFEKKGHDWMRDNQQSNQWASEKKHIELFFGVGTGGMENETIIKEASVNGKYSQEV